MGAILGRHAAVGLGLESTHGTAVSRTMWLRVMSVSNHLQQIDRTPRQHSQGPGVTHGGMPIAHTDGSITVSDLAFECSSYYNDDSIALFYAAMGAVADAGSGPSSYTHTFTLANTLPSWTIETIEGEDSNGDDSAVVTAGCVCSGLVWTIESGGSTPSTLAVTFNGQKDAGDTTAGSPSFGSIDAPTMYYHIGDLSWNSITIEKEFVRRITVTLANGLSVDRFGVGTQYREEPYLTGERSVTIEVMMERHQADALRASYTSGANSSLTFTLTSGSKTAANTFHAARIMSFGRDIQIAGVVMQTVTFRAFAVPAGGNGWSLVVTNDVENYDGS
ncbi:MAG: phage tail tube protein [Candidatus Limnocylindrus sp.]